VSKDYWQMVADMLVGCTAGHILKIKIYTISNLLNYCVIFTAHSMQVA